MIPVHVAQVYDREGADELCFLDITASHEKRDTILDVVVRTAEQVFMPLTVGGGIRTLEDIRRLLEAGADKVSINTAAVPATRFCESGSQIDLARNVLWWRLMRNVRRVARERFKAWEVFTHGGSEMPTGLDAVKVGSADDGFWSRRDFVNQYGSRWNQRWV